MDGGDGVLSGVPRVGSSGGGDGMNRRWTAEELATLARARYLANAIAALPERTPLAVRSQWTKLYGRPSARACPRPVPPAPTPGLFSTGRPPQTADERRVMHLLIQVRRLARQARVPVDAGALLAAMREGDWRQWADLDPLQATPVAGWTR